MAGRYDHFVRTQYVPSPVEYMQMAVSSQEQEQGQKLAEVGQAYDQAYNIQAAFDNDRQVRDEILGGIRQQTEEIAKGDVSSPELMAKYNRLVRDRKTVETLAGVQGNAMDYYRLMDEAKKYRTEYGNDYNVTPILAQMKQYGASGKEGFKAGAFSGTSVDKYIDVVKDIQGVLKDVKADVTDIEQSNGRYIIRTKDGSLDLETLMSKAGIQMNDPKYQKQIQNMLFHNAYTVGGGDTEKGYQKFRDHAIENTDAQISSIEKQLALLSKDKTRVKDVEAGTKALQELRDRRNKLTKMKDYSGEYAKDYMQNMALIAASPYAHKDFLQSMKGDPYGMIDARGRWQKKLQDEKLKKLKQEFNPNPDIPLPVFSGAALQSINLSAAQFNKDFGDLEASADNMPKMDRLVEERVSAPGAVSSGVLSGFGTTNLTESKSVDDRSKWTKFIDYAQEHGFQVDKEAFMNDKNPRHKDELRRVGSMFNSMKAGSANDKYANLGVSLTGNGFSPEEVASYISASIAPDGNMVELNGKRVPFSEVAASKEELAQGLLGKKVTAVLSPVTNKIVVSMGNNKVFTVNPDLDTQRKLKPIADLANNSKRITTSNIGGVPFLSYNSYNSTFGKENDLLQASMDKNNQPLPPRDTKVAAQEIAMTFGTKSVNEEGLNKMKDGEVYLFARSTKDGRIVSMPYNRFVKNKDYYGGTLDNPIAYYKEAGKFIPIEKSRYNMEEIVHGTVQSAIRPGGGMSGMVDKSSSVNDKTYLKMIMQSGDPDMGWGEDYISDNSNLEK